MFINYTHTANTASILISDLDAFIGDLDAFNACKCVCVCMLYMCLQVQIFVCVHACMHVCACTHVEFCIPQTNFQLMCLCGDIACIYLSVLYSHLRTSDSRDVLVQFHFPA